MNATDRPHWQLPPGVTRGLWEYAHSRPIAEQYDDYFSENRLFHFDEQVVLHELQRRQIAAGSLIADLGCGTGRVLVALARQGYRGLAIDLSEAMLRVVREKADAEELPIATIRANLVQLDSVADGVADAALLLFSTLGMIHGCDQRQVVLNHAARILCPNGFLALHVHNFWYNLYDPGGPWWVVGSTIRSLLSSTWERGDKFFPYRGIPNMYLHVFTRGELRRALRRAGFVQQRWIPLDPRRHRRLRWPLLLGNLRANGWIVIAAKRAA